MIDEYMFLTTFNLCNYIREIMITSYLWETEAEKANNLFQVPELLSGGAKSQPAECKAVCSPVC